MKEAITLSGVPETMLQTVYARAKESRGRGAMLFETLGERDKPAILFFHAMGVIGASSEPVAKNSAFPSPGPC